MHGKIHPQNVHSVFGNIFQIRIKTSLTDKNLIPWFEHTMETSSVLQSHAHECMGLHYYKERTRGLWEEHPQVRCARPPAYPRAPSQLLCADFVGDRRRSPHSPNLRTLVCATRCAAPPDALHAGSYYD